MLQQLVDEAQEIKVRAAQPKEYVEKLATAGFTKTVEKIKHENSVTKGEKLAMAHGFTKIPVAAIADYMKTLRTKRLEFDFTTIEEYVPEGKEIIPESSVEKVIEAKEAKIFSKFLVVGLKKKERQPDPIVIGLFQVPKKIEQWMDWAMDPMDRAMMSMGTFAGGRSIQRSREVEVPVIEQDWYFITGWI